MSTPATHTHDVSIKVGEYTNANGEKRNRTRRIGRVFTTEDGRQFIRMDAEQLNPITASLARAKGEDTVIINLWEVQPKEKPTNSSAPASDDDIPDF